MSSIQDIVAQMGDLGEDAATRFITYVDVASGTVTYVGTALPGTALSAASWRIKKILVDGTITAVTFAGSNSRFVHIWDNRASLSYG